LRRAFSSDAHTKKANTMDCIDQAIFTSAQTDRASGYHVVAASPGVRESDLRELAAWGPSHGSLLESAWQGASLNFHPLPSGAYCISRTTLAGWEYSGRGGARVHTHSLVVPPRVLAQFANNPLALWRAAAANGSVPTNNEIPSHLEALQLPGRAAAVDTALLAQLCANPGPDWMAALLQAALDAVTLAIVGGPPAEHVVAGLINCLPLECRSEFSFSTGLKFSSRRPFRIVALPADPAEQRRVERLYNVAVLEISGDPPAEFAPVGSWPRLIRRVLQSGRLSLLGSRLAAQSQGVSLADLPAFGLQMLEELDSGKGKGDILLFSRGETTLSSCPPGGGTIEHPPTEKQNVPFSPPPPIRREQAAGRWSVAHGPQPRSSAPPGDEKDSGVSGLGAWGLGRRPETQDRRPKTEDASGHLDLGNRPVMDKLDRLDDVVFDAIGGSEPALEELKELWPKLRKELAEPLLAESQEHYLRRALSAWAQGAQPDATRNPQTAIHLLEVLTTLFG
jgi:hypothetical protein